MPTYSYTAYDSDGVRISGVIASVNREAALEAMNRRGHFPLDLVEAKSLATERWWEREVFASRSMSGAGLGLFTRDLATLLKADIPLDETLRIASLQPLMPAKSRKVAAGVLERVLEGAALSEALAAAPDAFPDYYCRLVKAGEAGGSLAKVFEDLARDLEQSAETRAKVRQALVYPLLLLAAAIFALSIIVAVLIPAIAPLYKDAGAEPPIFIRTLIAVQEFVADNPAFVLLGLSGLSALVVAIFLSPAMRLARDRLLLRLPLVAGFIQKRETASAAGTLAMLLGNGMALLEGLHIMSGVHANRVYRDAAREAHDQLKEGATLTRALSVSGVAPGAKSGLFPELFLRLVSVGEASGQLEPMLLRAAQIYEADLKRTVERMTSLLTPILTIVIGLVVGGLIVSVMGAIVSVNDLAFR